MDNEIRWWGNCCNTYGEETKQMAYANRMGLGFWDDHIDVGGRRILDIGGGPVSLLLKTRNLGRGKIVDPSRYPLWTLERYRCRDISVEFSMAETIQDVELWDEVWIYNVLQHVQDPKLIIENAKRAGKIIRIFEWIDIPAHDGHPHELKQELLEEWIGLKGTVEDMNESGCVGRCFYGVFRC